MSRIHIVSFSEVSTAQQCQFKWDLAYRQRWVDPDPSPALQKGTLWHLVLEAHYRKIQESQQTGKPLDAADILAVVTPLLYNEDGGQTEIQELVEWMYAGYIEQYGIDPGWQVMAVEHAAEAWLPTDRGGRSNFKLKIKIDLIVKYQGRLWLIDHKSGKDLPTDKMLDLDPQFGLYTWGMRKLGKKVHGSIHNAARTLKYQDPKKPQPLNERFSRYMMYRTDPELDRIAIDTYRTARAAYNTTEGEAPRSLNSDTCRWRCFVGTTAIEQTNVLAASRRWYDGSLIELVTQNGRCLTGTPEHPILTDRGWQTLGSLEQGSYVVCHDGLETVVGSPVSDNVNNRPPSLGEIFDTTAGVGSLDRIPASSCQLHGQRPAGEIEVVRPDSTLAPIHLAEPGSQVILTGTDYAASLPAPSFQAQGFDGRAGLDSPSIQNRVDTAPAYVERLGQGIDGFSGQESGGNLVAPVGTLAHRRGVGTGMGEGGTLCRGSALPLDTSRFGLRSERNANGVKTLAQRPECVTADSREISQGRSLLVSLDKVIDVRYHESPGWVFDLSTVDGWYVANGIIAHNCSYTEACLAGMKGIDITQFLLSTGFVQDFQRH